MKLFLGVIIGFVLGILITLFVLFIISSNSYYPEDGVQVQYVEVKGKKGNVTLYTGMPKDSVLLLVGKPDKIDLRTTGGIIFEDWDYNLKNDYDNIPDLNIDFIPELEIELVNGRLEGVRQR